MKKRILTQVITAAAAIAFPLAINAQDSGNQASDAKLQEGGFTSGAVNSPGSGTGTYSSGGTFSGDAAPAPGKKSGGFIGGIVVHDGTAYVVHKLQNEMALPDGLKVRPDGTVVDRDGSIRSLGAGQVLTMDGKVMGAPFTPVDNMKNPVKSPEGIHDSSGTPGATTGIGESGGNAESQEAPASPVPDSISSEDPAIQPGDSGGSISTEPREF